MSGFGTDIVALACIVGSAATSGAATFAFLDRGDPVQADCAVEALSVNPNLVVSRIDGAHAIVITGPRMHGHTAHGCQAVVAKEVRVNLEMMRREMEHTRMQLEVVRGQAEEARAAAGMVRLRGREARLLREEALKQAQEAQLEMQEALEKAKEARMEGLAKALEGTEVRVEVVKKGSGGQMD